MNPTLFKREDDWEKIIEGSLWVFEKRDNSYGQTGNYHGNVVSQVVEQCLLRYTKPGDLAVDPFFGNGTTGYVALSYNRRVLGVELQPYMVEKVTGELYLNYPSERENFEIICADSATEEARQHIEQLIQARGWEKPKLLFFHPPYHNIVHFSDDPRCLGNKSSLEDFLSAWQTVVRIWTPLLHEEGGMALVIGDMRIDGEWIPLGFYMDAVVKINTRLRRHAIVVKNMTDNKALRGRKALFKHLAHEINWITFAHEYVFLYDYGKRPKFDRCRETNGDSQISMEFLWCDEEGLDKADPHRV